MAALLNFEQFHKRLIYLLRKKRKTRTSIIPSPSKSRIRSAPTVPPMSVTFAPSDLPMKTLTWAFLSIRMRMACYARRGWVEAIERQIGNAMRKIQDSKEKFDTHMNTSFHHLKKLNTAKKL